MKRFLTLFAVVATMGFVSCQKELADATITANDVTVEEGATVKINATTNSSAAITYVCDNTAVATVSAAGEVTGVKAGNANITLKVAEVKDQFKAAEKTIKVTVTAKEVPPTPKAEMKIDGDFSDWAALEKGTFSQFFGDEDSMHPALTACKVYANTEKIFVYVEWDADLVSHDPGDPDNLDEWGDPEGMECVPFHVYINTDGDATTGGFSDQFSDACTDVLLEGFVYPDGATLGSYSPSAFSWAGEVNGSSWKWDGLGEVECEGAGVEGSTVKYELSISCADLKALGFQVADVFSIGFDIQQSWDSVGILPSTAPSEDNASGILPSLEVKVQK